MQLQSLFRKKHIRALVKPVLLIFGVWAVSSLHCSQACILGLIAPIRNLLSRWIQIMTKGFMHGMFFSPFIQSPAKPPSAAASLNHPFVNTQFDDAQSHEAANPIPSAIGSGKYDMVYTGRNRKRRESCAIKETLDEDDDSIPETTDFSIWEKGYRTLIYVACNRESRELCAVEELKNIHNIESVESIKREIHILSQLEHPNILKYYAHGIVSILLI